MNPKTEKAIELLKEVYRVGPVGGSLHVVVDDMNIGNDSIEYCLQKPEITEHEKELALLLLEMSKTQRRKTITIFHSKNR